LGNVVELRRRVGILDKTSVPWGSLEDSRGKGKITTMRPRQREKAEAPGLGYADGKRGDRDRSVVGTSPGWL